MGFILLQVVLGFAKIRIHLAHREEIPSDTRCACLN